MRLAEPREIELRDGRLHIAHDVYEELFDACIAVALLERDGGWWLLPLRGGAGGLQLKIRNARGDRVVESQEFFRSQGLDDSAQAQRLLLRFDDSQGGFLLTPCKQS
jgi:hypothetical protein